ncbi:centrosomal protein of 72 kDa isoform X2 [Triplophysa rosa]|uniref:centrosomal protein of 72 kDa isoform X2 n=1 Tax=Triplophysa rosa TaxID=992332 RepID=UPI0025461129|nr:centrosomal protein of 72 kDa isoform X2 [Triplophysa rosa]
MREVALQFKTMAADDFTITEQWIRDKLNLQHICLADVRSLSLPGTYEGKICHVGSALKNFVRLKTLDLSHNALITVKGIEHLELLENLNLYYNRLESLRDVFSLHKLQNLTELDLRLNPVVRRHPHYRLYFIHAITKLRKLDDCPVRDRERKAALLHFSSENNLEQIHKKQVLTQDANGRSSELRIKAVERMMKTISLLEGNEEAALNEVYKHQTLSPEISQGPGAHAQQGAHRVTFVSPVAERRHAVKTQSGTVRGQSVFTPHPSDLHGTSHTISFMTRSSHRSVSVVVSDAHTLNARLPLCVAEGEHGALKMRNQTENSSNPVLNPPRLTYRTQDPTSGRSPPASERKPRRGAYRKPMELLLGVMEEHWSGKKENHHERTFLMNTVQILTMMENDVADGEQEIQTLKETVKTLNSEAELQKEQRQDEIGSLKLQLQQAQESIESVNGQLKTLLEENVALQKQLIRTEEKLLTSRLKKLTDVKDRGEPCESEELNRRRAQEHQIRPPENYKSMIARNECLLRQLEEALMG